MSQRQAGLLFIFCYSTNVQRGTAVKPAVLFKTCHLRLMNMGTPLVLALALALLWELTELTYAPCLVPCAMFPFLFFLIFFFLTEAEIDGKNKSHLNEYFNIQYLQVIRCCGPTSRFQALISDRG